MTHIRGNRSPPHSALDQLSRSHNPQLPASPSQYKLNLTMLIVDCNPPGKDIHATLQPSIQTAAVLLKLSKCQSYASNIELRGLNVCATCNFDKKINKNP